ncbi:polysaccharide deacetylase family protein [Paenibacillus sp. PL91]|uniref:polysaccharide deacetylase family protein n=1 Tax=Paenibacillus sp. PL91 TaxID=2729538 RepID=UPI00145C3CF0|nr:polysaccharide deacetylase family protein [Paenibacillus sp. PL91]MBC9201529.1 polysaccharide deacetylase [Paenibacillus sp. PL91]
MRRVLLATIGVMVVWFGLFEMGGFTAYKSEGANEREIVQAREAVASFTTYYEAKPLLAKQVSYENDVKQESGKAEPSVTAPQNDREEAAPVDPNQKILYLTFDDGPSENTEQVLNILKQEGISATFFVLGEHVLKQPKIAKRIVEEGHSIGNHTFNHKYERLYGGFAEFAEQIMKTDEAIYRTTGVRTTLVRAPGGTYSNFDRSYFDAMAAAGYQVHDWNVDSGDSKRIGVPASEILTTIKNSKLAKTLNVLLHDSAGHAESVKALPAIIKYYKSKGYAFAKLTDQIDPIQFKVAKKLKWTRAQATKLEKAKLVQFSEKLGQSVLLAQTKNNAPSLILHRGQESLALGAKDYVLRDGTIEVSLFKLTEWVYGTVEFDIDHGAIEAYVDGNRVLALPSQASQTSTEQADEIVVPVRSTLQKFGMEITKYIYNEQQREIWVTEQT